ncbi:unnamed protein product [Brassica oleracea]
MKPRDKSEQCHDQSKEIASTRAVTKITEVKWPNELSTRSHRRRLATNNTIIYASRIEQSTNTSYVRLLRTRLRSKGAPEFTRRRDDRTETHRLRRSHLLEAHRRWNSKTRPTLTFINDGASGEIEKPHRDTTSSRDDTGSEKPHARLLIRAKLYYRTTSISAREEESRRTAKRNRAREKESSGGRTRTNAPEAE